MKFLTQVFLTLVFTGLLPLSAHACGVESQCKVGENNDRHYYIAMLKGHDGKTPISALIFAHGYQGSGLGIIRNKGLQRMASDLGIAFIAVKSKGSSWSLPNSPNESSAKGANELAYFDAVKADIIKRFPIDPKRIVMTGSSTGGMVTWTLACERSAEFAGFIPMSGTFWSPVPRTCKGPVANIVHMHGDKDRTVPLTGRPVAGTHQGSVPAAMKMYRKYGAFDNAQSRTISGLRCENSANSDGNILNFCLYKGGHSFRAQNIIEAWRMLQAAGQI